MGKLNIYVIDPACLTVIMRKGEREDTIKLTSLHPFMSDRKFF